MRQDALGLEARTHNAANTTEAVDANFRNHVDGAGRISAVPAEALAGGREHATTEHGTGNAGQTHDISWAMGAVECAVTESQKEEAVGRRKCGRLCSFAEGVLLA